MKPLHLVVLVLLLGAAGVAHAQLDDDTDPITPQASTSANYTLSATIGGGGTSSGGNYTLSGSVAENVTGIATSQNYSLHSGYWARLLVGLAGLDANGDGLVTPADAVYVLNRAGQVLNADNRSADVDGDLDIDADDASAIIDALEAQTP